MKKLEWRDVFENGFMYETDQIFIFGPFNFYLAIERQDHREFVLWLESTFDKLWIEEFTTLKKAQAAAQKYYNQFLKDMKNADN